MNRIYFLQYFPNINEEFTGLPFNYLEAILHFGPCSLYTLRIISSSSFVHAYLLIFGSNLFKYLSRIYLPVLPGKCLAISAQFLSCF